MIKTQKNIPLPRGLRPQVPYNKMPYGEMDVGESFIYPLHPNGVTYTQTAAMSATRRYSDRKFTSRIVEEKGQRLVRVWRIA